MKTILLFLAILFLVGCNNTEPTMKVEAKYKISIGDATFCVRYSANDYIIQRTNGWAGRKPTFIIFTPINKNGTLGNEMKLPIHNLYYIEELK
jgi:hypothetical protein